MPIPHSVSSVSSLPASLPVVRRPAPPLSAPPRSSLRPRRLLARPPSVRAASPRPHRLGPRPSPPSVHAASVLPPSAPPWSVRAASVLPPSVPPRSVRAASVCRLRQRRLLASTAAVRLGTEFRTADDDEVRARIVRSLLPERATKCARVAEPDQILRRVATVYDTAGSTRARALALRMFGCLAELAKDSVHVRSLILSGLSSSNAAEVKAALFAAGCFCKLSEDFSCITLQVLARLITSPTSEARVILAAIKAFSKLDCTLAVIHRVHEVGKQVLGNLEDVFKAEMFLALSRLASKSIILFGDQVEFLLLFLGHESSLSMKTMALKCLCFMFRRDTFYLPVASTVFGTLLN